MSWCVFRTPRAGPGLRVLLAEGLSRDEAVMRRDIYVRHDVAGHYHFWCTSLAYQDRFPEPNGGNNE